MQKLATKYILKLLTLEYDKYLGIDAVDYDSECDSITVQRILWDI